MHKTLAYHRATLRFVRLRETTDRCFLAAVTPGRRSEEEHSEKEDVPSPATCFIRFICTTATAHCNTQSKCNVIYPFPADGSSSRLFLGLTVTVLTLFGGCPVPSLPPNKSSLPQRQQPQPDCDRAHSSCAQPLSSSLSAYSSYNSSSFPSFFSSIVLLQSIVPFSLCTNLDADPVVSSFLSHHHHHLSLHHSLLPDCPSSLSACRSLRNPRSFLPRPPARILSP
jgi:hypothetical protein